MEKPFTNEPKQQYNTIIMSKQLQHKERTISYLNAYKHCQILQMKPPLYSSATNNYLLKFAQSVDC